MSNAAINLAQKKLAEMREQGTAMLIESENFGNLVGYINNKAVPIPLEEVAGKLKIVNRNNSVLLSGRSIGISFGD